LSQIAILVTIPLLSLILVNDTCIPDVCVASVAQSVEVHVMDVISPCIFYTTECSFLYFLTKFWYMIRLHCLDCSYDIFQSLKSLQIMAGAGTGIPDARSIMQWVHGAPCSVKN